MAELRQIPFNHSTVNGLVQSMSGPIRTQEQIANGEHPIYHNADVDRREDGTVWVTCDCQPNQPWLHHSKQTNEEILATFNAHLSYATRPKLKPD